MPLRFIWRSSIQIAMDILAYHYGIEDSDIDELLNTRHSPEFLELIPSFNEWSFSPYDLSVPHSRALMLWTFEELGILGRPRSLPYFLIISTFFAFSSLFPLFSFLFLQS